MITYVNTVLVSNKANDKFATNTNLTANTNKNAFEAFVGAPVFYDMDKDEDDAYTPTATAKNFKIGVVTSEVSTIRDKKGKVTYIPVIKWSNVIKSANIKSVTLNKYAKDEEDKITISKPESEDEATKSLIADGGVAFSLRLTFKDMPTRYRRWTETYSYVTEPGDTIDDVLENIGDQINKEYKRARVSADTSDISGTGLVITALKYDDDEQAVTENVYGKVRFDANMYYTNSKAPGWAANNKYAAPVVIKKELGKTNASSAKLVRDRERASFDYMGVLHRCCWYDPQPKMITDINAKYAGVTVEFENAYHTADDLMRQTKQTVEFYASNAADLATEGTAAKADAAANLIYTALSNIAKNNMNAAVHAASENAKVAQPVSKAPASKNDNVTESE